MPIPKIPVHQLNALPLITAEAAAEPGEISIVGNTMTRYWNGAATGINAVARINDGGGASYLVSNWLDVRGCTGFQAVVVRTATALAGDESGVQLTLLIQYRTGTVDPFTPPRTNEGVHQGSPGNCVPGAFGGPFPQSIVCSRNLCWSSVAGPNNQTAFIGFNVRIWLRWTVVPVASQLWTLELWGTQ